MWGVLENNLDPLHGYIIVVLVYIVRYNNIIARLIIN